MNPAQVGTKAAALYQLEIPAGGEAAIHLRLAPEELSAPRSLGKEFDQVFADRIGRRMSFTRSVCQRALPKTRPASFGKPTPGCSGASSSTTTSSSDWLEGTRQQPPPPAGAATGRNADWPQLYNRDVISMPDKWEYPWYAAWDLAFHMIPFTQIDPALRQAAARAAPARVVHAPERPVAGLRVQLQRRQSARARLGLLARVQDDRRRGQRDRVFLSRCFQKLVISFTWWVNRKDLEGRNLFAGGFLGLDNIGVFDRSKPLPAGGHLQQADGTAWMAFFCATMLSIALELARDNPATEDMASKFFEHFVAIADAINTQGGTGLWDEEDGFYYDQLASAGAPSR